MIFVSSLESCRNLMTQMHGETQVVPNIRILYYSVSYSLEKGSIKKNLEFSRFSGLVGLKKSISQINIQLKLLWKFHQDPTCFGCFREDLKLVLFGLVWYGMVWFGMVWLGLVWDNIHQKLLWNFHQNPTFFGCFREDLVMVWYGMVWFGMVWFGLYG